mmetsp:Transcript_63284/g.100487  ORF Transcript_63284/g.100487 Transcript_63284/m.100487 type:complete len:214 (-) Transcript_63284:215-856(-)
MALQPMHKDLIGHHQHVAENVRNYLAQRSRHHIHLQTQSKASCEVPLNLGRRKHCDLHPTNDWQPIQYGSQLQQDRPFQRDVLQADAHRIQDHYDLASAVPGDTHLQTHTLEVVLDVKDRMNVREVGHHISKVDVLEADLIQRLGQGFLDDGFQLLFDDLLHGFLQIGPVLPQQPVEPFQVIACSIRPLFGLFEQPKRHIIIVLHRGGTEVDP